MITSRDIELKAAAELSEARRRALHLAYIKFIDENRYTAIATDSAIATNEEVLQYEKSLARFEAKLFAAIKAEILAHEVCADHGVKL